MSGATQTAMSARWFDLKDAPPAALLVVAAFLVMVVFGETIAPYAPNAINLAAKQRPPVFFGGDLTHVLGTDWLGRDILSRLIVGARVSFVVVVGALLVGGIGGAALGVAAGYLGGWLDAILMRLSDATLAFPIILLALLMNVTLGPSTGNLMLALSLVMWARFARLIRGEVLLIREKNFIALAKTSGVADVKIMWRHVVPNIANVLIVMSTLQVGWIIIVEASLSFLGAGVPPPDPAWGSMASRGREFIGNGWWISTMPCLFIVLVCLSFNALGDWLQRRLDPANKSSLR